MDKNKQQTINPGLYLVSTPIGNMADFTFRAVDVLKNIKLKSLLVEVETGREDHMSIEYSKGDTAAGDAILYAENKRRKATEAVKPVIIINSIEFSRLVNHSRKIN